MNALSHVDEFVPSPEDAKLARAALDSLAPATDGGHASPKLVVEVGRKQQQVALPAGALKLFVAMLAEAARGNAVTLIPSHKELTTQEAADFLNVSRPFVVKILERGEMPYHRRGSHRRIKFSDLMVYKRRSDVAAEKAFQELVDLSNELKLDK